MSNEIAEKKEKPVTIYDYLSSPKAAKELERALPKGKDVQRYIRGVLSTLAMEKEGSKLLLCSPLSIMKCVMTCAQLGLDLDAKGHAYMVPYKGEATVIPGWKGYIFRARQSPILSAIYVEAVYSCDSFSVVKGTDPKIEHYPDVSSAKYGIDKDITHFYAVAKMKSGDVEFEVMTRAQVDKIKGATDIWNIHYGQMGRKTVWRRLAGRLQFPEVSDLIIYDNEIENKMREEPESQIPEFDEKANQTLIRKHCKSLGWDKNGFAEYLAARGVKEWGSLSPKEKTGIEYDLSMKAKEKK